jgi:hypothetical protein
MSLGVVIFIVLLIAGLVWAITQSKKPAPSISETSAVPGD